MSTYIVGRDHIRYLITAALSQKIAEGHFSYLWNGERKNVRDREAGTKAGQMLWSENIRSVQARYPDDKPGELPGPCEENFIYSHSRESRIPLTAVSVLKACHCLSYQSCETDAWEKSEAYAFIKALEGYAERAVPGYDDAPGWDISEKEQSNA